MSTKFEVRKFQSNSYMIVIKNTWLTAYLQDFSQEIDRKDLYLRYLYKLHDLHVTAGNFTEAAFTLKLHSRQLDWSDDEIPTNLRTNPNRHPTLVTQCELKEALYYEIIDFFSKAKVSTPAYISYGLLTESFAGLWSEV